MNQPTTNADIVKAVYAAQAAADLDAMLELCDPALTITQAEALPWGGHYVGRAGLTDFVTKLISTIGSKVEHQGLFEAGDRVIQQGRTRGTVHATGVAFDIAEVHIWTVRDGRVVAAEFYIDTPAMLEALGEAGSA